MEKELVKASESVPVLDEVIEPGRMIVAASNPEQLNQSHEKLTTWATAKVEAEKSDLHDLEVNYKIAVKNKWRSEHMKKLIAKQKGRIEFYEKIEAALKAGYYIIPEWQLNVFAIRTTRKTVKNNFVQGNPWVRPSDQKTNTPAIGEGHYVSPQAATHSEEADVSGEGQKPGTKLVTQRWATDWRDVDFPFLTTAKPEIIRATADAMKKLLFDELGVAPQTKRADPIVVGKICSKEKIYGRPAKTVYFMISWFLDTDTL